VISTPLCAWTAALLAQQTADSVCLVDLSAREPGPHAVVESGEGHGFDDWIAAPALEGNVVKFLRKASTNLWLLPAGARAGDAAPLEAEPFRDCVLQLVEMFDYVLVNGSSWSAEADGSVLGHAVDGVVLVVEANATRREPARRVASRLQAAHIRVLGAVLTNRTFPIPEALYRKL